MFFGISSSSSGDVPPLLSLQEFLGTNLLPPFMPPPVAYRLNVWMTDWAVLPNGGTGVPAGGLLFKQCDVPPSAFPELESEYVAEPTVLTWMLRDMPPDRVFRCTVEACCCGDDTDVLGHIHTRHGSKRSPQWSGGRH